MYTARLTTAALAAAMLAGCSAVRQMDADEGRAESRAAAISAAVNEIPGITAAAVAISGQTAVVAINIEGQPDDAALIGLKQEAERAARRADRDVKRVAVSAAPEMFDELTGGDGAADAPRGGNEDVFTNVVPSL